MLQFVKICRTIHRWMGLILLPWVIVIGATGFYLNHHKLVLSWIGQTEFSEAGFSAQQLPVPKSKQDALALARTVWPNEDVQRVFKKDYHNRPSVHVKKQSGTIILSIPTGHYYVKTPFSRLTYAPDGTLLHEKRYWGRVFKQLHESGWLGGGMGTWLADTVALAMIVFGTTGLIIWSTPKLWRLRASRGNTRRALGQGQAASPLS
jgi:uncharacterized iron-regulated membrane protein